MIKVLMTGKFLGVYHESEMGKLKSFNPKTGDSCIIRGQVYLFSGLKWIKCLTPIRYCGDTEYVHEKISKDISETKELGEIKETDWRDDYIKYKNK
jgi:hypothetical protein